MDSTSTDPALWTTRPRYGVAGGPVEIVLTQEGLERAFSVGAQVRRIAASALWALWYDGERAYLGKRDGERFVLTPLAKRFSQAEAWGVLRDLGLCESFSDAVGDGVRLTDAGRAAVARGMDEQQRLLERCRRAAEATSQDSGR